MTWKTTSDVRKFWLINFASLLDQIGTEQLDKSAVKLQGGESACIFAFTKGGRCAYYEVDAQGWAALAKGLVVQFVAPQKLKASNKTKMARS
jgi:hypothetical protein